MNNHIHQKNIRNRKGQRVMLMRLVENIIGKHFLLYSLMKPNIMSRVQGKSVDAIVEYLRIGSVFYLYGMR